MEELTSSNSSFFVDGWKGLTRKDLVGEFGTLEGLPKAFELEEKAMAVPVDLVKEKGFEGEAAAAGVSLLAARESFLVGG